MRALIPWLAALLLHIAVRVKPEWIEEVYVPRVYPRIAGVVAAPARWWGGLVGADLERRMPSLSELVLALLAIGAVSGIVRRWRRARRESESRSRVLVKAALDLVALAGGLYLFFLMSWGVLHARRPLADHLSLDTSPRDTAALVHAFENLSADASRLRASATLDDTGLFRAPRPLAPRIEAGLDAATAVHAQLEGPRPLLRAPLASSVLIAARLTGIFSPFTGESHVAAGLPETTRPFVALHEAAHRMGWAREDEANFIAFLAGRASGDPDIAYAVTAQTLRWLLSRIAEHETASFLDLVAGLDAGVVADLSAVDAFWAREQSAAGRALSSVATATNDAYLRSHGTSDGVRSYGRMVDLVIAWNEQRRAGD